MDLSYKILKAIVVVCTGRNFYLGSVAHLCEKRFVSLRCDLLIDLNMTFNPVSALSSRVTSALTKMKNKKPHKHACRHYLIFFRCAQRELFMLQEQVILMLLCNREKRESCERVKRI